MSFFFRKARRKLFEKKYRRSKTGAEIQRRLDDYLDSSLFEPVRFLVGFWNDQQALLSYKEIREAILAEEMAIEVLELWQQDYSVLVTNHFRSLWEEAITTGAFGQPLMDNFYNVADFAFDINLPSVANWLDNRAASFITELTNEQRNAIAEMVKVSATGKYGTDELAKMIRPCIGLTKSQSLANFRYYDQIKEQLRINHPKMSAASIRQKAKEAAMKYAERQHRERATTIALTEMEFAYNHGMDEAVRQAQEQNLLGIMEKRWSAAADERMCDTCGALEGTLIEMEGEFDFPGKVLFPGHKRTPPAHPRCRCAVEYVEVSPPII